MFNPIKISPLEFLSAFYDLKYETIYMRTFYDKKSDRENSPGYAQNFTFDSDQWTDICERLEALNTDSRPNGIFFIVNGGGHTDANVVHVKAQFVEMDHGSFDEQYAKIQAFSLQPSIIVKTQKSLHCYWLMRGAKLDQFRSIQSQLINYFDGDSACVNESRVMRVPGFYHSKYEPVMVECIKWNTEIVYTQDQLSDALPALPKQKYETTKIAAIINEGGRNGTLFKLACSLQEKGIDDDAIRVAIHATNEKQCNPPLGHGEVDALLLSALKYNKPEIKVVELERMPLSQATIAQMQADDILSDSTFSELMGFDEVQRERLNQLLADRARELSVKTRYDKLYIAHKAEHKKTRKAELVTIQSNIGENVTNYSTDQYPDFRCGTWICDDNGVRFTGPFGVVWACPHPIILSRRLINLETRDEKAVIAFFRDGSWKERIFDKATILSASKTVPAMANCGILVTSESAKYLVKYLCDIESMNADIIPIQYSTSKMGWNDEYSEFMPFTHKNVTFDSEMQFTQIYNSIRSHGNRDAHIQLLREVRKRDRVEPMFCIAASLASVLVKPCGVLPFILHLFGDAGKGKTVATMIAASIWGDPNEDGYLTEPNSTAAGFEAYLDFLNNMPFICDDMSRIRRTLSSRDAGDFSEFIYFLCGMSGKKRSNVHLGVNKPKTWRNCSITNGERPITREVSNGGELLRVIELKTKSGIIFDDGAGGKNTADNVRENYGFFGREFIEIIRDIGFDEVRRIHEAFTNALYALDSENKKEGKQILPMALLLTADKIFTDYIMHDDVYLDMDMCFNMVIDKDAMNDNERAYEYIINDVRLNEKSFKEGSFENPPQRMGYFKGDWVLINPNTFSRIAEQGNFNKRMFIEWAVEHQKAEANAPRIDKRHNYNGVHGKFITIKMPNESAYEEKSDVDESIPF